MGKVILSLGMGVDSSGILTRFLLEPETRGFDLGDLIVMTAMTGDEFSETEAHMERFLLPLMRQHSVRYVQLSRGGQYARSRYKVLDDSTCPRRMHMVGPWRLSDYQLRIGSVPQFAAKKRDCSRKAKGQPLDWWKEDHLTSEPYDHLLGFSAEEGSRILRDSSYGSDSRLARYPLAEWGWTRQDTLGYLHEVFGTIWPRSCCVYCPFARSDPAYLADRWRREPDGAALALVMERRSIALNPRSTLFARGSALQFAIEHRLDTAISLSEQLLGEGRWALYDVRRIYRAGLDKETKQPIATKKGTAWRSVETLAEGTHQEMHRQLRRIAASKNTIVTTDSFAITRAPIITLAPGRFPATEQFLSIGPAGVCDKRQKSFAGLWSQLVDQTTLFAA